MWLCCDSNRSVFGVWCFALPLQALQHTSSCGAKARTEESNTERAKARTEESDTEGAEARTEESDTRGDTRAEANGEGHGRTFRRTIQGPSRIFRKAIEAPKCIAGGPDSGEHSWVIM